jgi:hypothetical protein
MRFAFSSPVRYGSRPVTRIRVVRGSPPRREWSWP